MTKTFYPLYRRQSGEQGFTLVEMAVVLTVAAIVIGTIWVAAERVWEGYRISRAMQQITRTTQNIREYYMNAQKMTAGDITAALDKANLFPFEMRRNLSAGPGNTPIDHPFNNSLTSGAAPANGSFHVVGVTCSNGSPLATTCFRIRMQGLESGTCIDLLEAVPVNDSDLGVIGIGTGNAAPLQDIAATMLASPASPDPGTVKAWCNLTGATNEVDWDFKLHN